MAGERIKVLLVEDCPTDALIVQEQLLQMPGVEFAVTRVERLAGALERLWNERFDVVLLDLSLPDSDGLQTFVRLRDATGDVPVIILSDRTGEGLAVSAVKAGAEDYLLKGQLQEEVLARSIRYAIERKRSEAALRLSGDELRETHEQLRQLLEHSPVVIYAVKLEGEHFIPHLVSESVAPLLGCPAQEAMSYAWWLERLHPEDRERAVGSVNETIAAGDSRTEYRLRHTDGRFVWIDDVRRLVRDAAGKPAELIGVWTDITERKRAEEAVRNASGRATRSRRTTVLVELAILLVSAAMVYVLASAFDWLEVFTRQFLSSEAEHLDEVVLTVLFISVGMIVFAARRWRESERELVDRQHGQTALQFLHGELDHRVRQRTAELARTNEALRAEIGERRRAESERERFFTLSSDLLCIVGFDGYFKRLNPAFEKTLGFTEAEMCAVPLVEFIHPDDRGATMEEIARIGTGAKSLNFENRHRCKDGSFRWVLWTAAPFVDDGTLYAVGHDITGRKEAETGLRSSEERFRQVVESIREVFWMREVERHRIIYVSPGYEEIWGRSREWLYASADHFEEDVHPDDRRALLHAAREKQIAGTYDETFRIVRPDGTIRWIRSRASPVRNAAGEVYRIAGVAEDITERKLAEQRLRLQLAVTSVLAEVASPTEINSRILETLCLEMRWDLGGLWMVDRKSSVLCCAEVWHRASAELKEFADASRRLTLATGQGLPGCVWASARPEWSMDVSRDARSLRCEQIGHLAQKGWIGIPITIRDDVLGVMEFFTAEMQPPDAETLTMLSALGAQIGIFIERRQLAELLRQAQKMEAIGTLAGGIAHDFNNVLACIGGYTELVILEVGGDPRVHEHLAAVLRATKRAEDLVRQILAFSRQHELERKSIQLRPVVEEALELLRATMPAGIELEVSLASDVPDVLADATQVHQIVMNLCTNAAHAMRGHAGRLVIALDKFEVDKELAVSHPGLRPGSHVRLSVSDTGSGMDQETLRRVFDPFFTTKPPGEGTGLGLAVVHGIMQSHEGAVTVYSHPGEGTMFHLYFPPDASVGPVADAGTPGRLRGHGERILFVDDEPLLVRLGKQILEMHGYVVDAHTDATKALAAVREHPDAYDLVITDQMMPGLTGTALAAQIQEVSPDLPIILTTGFSATLTAESVRALGVRKLVMKPLTVEALGTVVAAVLAQPATVFAHVANSSR